MTVNDTGTGGGGAVVECPEDDGTAAALTLVGLGFDASSGVPNADVGDAGTSDAGLEFGGVLLPGLVGWASEPGLGTGATIGGAAGEVVTARTSDELVDWASRPEPLVIRVCGVLRAPELRISSHKTLLGVGNAATIEGGLRIGGEGSVVRNVVIKNLRVNAAFSDVEGDAVKVHQAHHVWIDHCELFDSSGNGALEVLGGSDFVTVSWTKFHFTPNMPDIERRFGCRIGDHEQVDAQAEEAGHLKVTLHHDWWAEDVRQRAPRVQFGDVHVFNNYYSIGERPQEYSIWAAIGSRVLLERDYFQGVTNPHEVKTEDAQLLAVGNVYDGSSGLMQSTGSAFVPPYAYTLDAALSVPALVMQGAGPQ